MDVENAIKRTERSLKPECAFDKHVLIYSQKMYPNFAHELEINLIVSITFPFKNYQVHFRA
jgi:hypothetical protein